MILFKIFMVYIHFKNLEENTYQRRPADFIFILSLAAFTILGISAYFKYTQVWSIFYMVVIYLNCKLSRDMQIFIFGLPIPMPAPYLPFMFMLLGFQIHEFLGFCIGHIIYFFEDVFPKLPTSQGRKVFAAPGFLKNLCRNLEV